MQLTPDQLRAVQTRSRLLFVNAGPGSGKTRVIVERIKHLVQTGVEPSKILAITFTNKSAKVMKERLETMKIRGVTASTMHSLAVRLLMQDGEPFSIFDQDDCNSIIKKLCKKHKLTDKNDVYEVSDEIALLKDNQITAVQCASKHRNIFLEYEGELFNNNALDFSDLINSLVKKSVNCHSRWNHILVDEVQDLSNAQILVVKHLHDGFCKTPGNTITLVGDIDQSVYEWRNAKPNVIMAYVNEQAEIIGLGTNFRSTRAVVHYSRKLIGHNKNRIEKSLAAHTEEFGSKPKVRVFFDSEEEAEFVADICATNKDVCVLYRSNWMTAQLELALKKAKVNYTISDSIQFLDRKEIKDVLSYIRVAINSKDTVSLRRSIQSPKRGVGPKVLDKLTKFEDILDNEKLQDYTSLIYMLRERKADAGEAVRGLILQSKYMGHEESDRQRNLDQLVSLLSGKSLEEAMFDLTGGCPTEDDDSRIHLMTLHSSKGTEYNKVIIIGCEEGITPHINSENLEEERRLFYVGMTRAEEDLIMTYTRRRLSFGSYSPMQPSRFFNEIGISI